MGGTYSVTTGAALPVPFSTASLGSNAEWGLAPSPTFREGDRLRTDTDVGVAGDSVVVFIVFSAPFLEPDTRATGRVAVTTAIRVIDIPNYRDVFIGGYTVPPRSDPRDLPGTSE